MRKEQSACDFKTSPILKTLSRNYSLSGCENPVVVVMLDDFLSQDQGFGL